MRRVLALLLSAFCVVAFAQGLPAPNGPLYYQAGIVNGPQTVAPGAAGTVLASNGPNAPPSFQPGGGSVTNLTGAMTYTPNCAVQTNNITASAGTGTLTINNPTGCTPYDTQRLEIRAYFSASGIAYAFGTQFHFPSSNPAPAQSTAAGMDELIFEWEAANNRYDLVKYIPGY